MNKSNLTGGGYYESVVSSSEKRNWKLVNFCEFDKYAIKSYCAIHNVDESLNLGDITKIDETKLKPFSMICGGSPCQDFSVAGKQKGSVWTCKDCGHEYNPLTVHWSKRDKCPQCNSSNIEKTRSSLLVEYLRVIRANKPNFGIYENVKNIVGKQFRDTTFKLFEDELHEYGYNTYWKVLNAKNYGIPQNRERVYLIFIRKDLDNGQFKFPEPFDNGIRLKDILEDNVDDKYYLSEKTMQKFKLYSNPKGSDIKISGTLNPDKNVQDRVRVLSVEGISQGLRATDYKDPVKIINGIDKSCNEPKFIDNANCITSREDRGISNRKGEGTDVLECPETSYCIDANYYKGTSPEEYVKKHRRQLVFEERTIKIPQATKQGYIECEVGGVADLSYPNSKTRRGRVQENGTISPTITATETGICKIESPIRIRKLTPKECFRLMGFSDQDFDAAKNAGISNSQLYKQAGNSIVVDVLYYIYVELYKAMPYLFEDLKLSSFFSGIGAFEAALDRLYEGINSGNFINPQVE